jgi:proline racemase
MKGAKAMDLSRVIWCADTHTECDPTRLVISGIPPLPHVGMKEKRDYFATHHDDLRRFLMHEPRGHQDMFGAVITDSVRDDCDFGLIFIDTDGYLDFCGHGVMAATTVMLELMGLTPIDSQGIVSVETPAGVIKARAIREGALSIAVEGVPSFMVERGFVVPTSVGTVPVDIAFAGNFFGFVDASDLHIDVSYGNMRQLVTLAMEIKHQLNHRKWTHPESGESCKVELVEILDEPVHPEARTKTLVVFGDGQVARDPCASGTCATLAVETARGNLQVGEEYVCEGIVGSIYRASVLRTCRVGSSQAIVPEIRGRTFITGMSQFVLCKDDPLPSGWLLR